jgi:NTE family protein
VSRGNGLRTVNLALQGGGAHGAFTWGALDALLEDRRVRFEGVCGASAGAMNAVVLAHGLLKGGRQGARDALAAFWNDVGRSGLLWRAARPPDSMLSLFGIDPQIAAAGMQTVMETWGRLLSPYQFNPWNFDPLRQLLERHVEFRALADESCLKLFICATNVRSGKVRIFDNNELGADAVLASACLPQLFKAVEIDGEAYWDGGYMGNPALYPLFYRTRTQDIVIVHVNPIRRETVPRTPSEIALRVNEITFNSSLMREMRAIAFAARLVEQGWLKDEYAGRLRRMYVHSIRDDEAMSALDGTGKLSPDPQLLDSLYESGRATAAAWLKQHFRDVGRRDSIDIRAEFL